MAKSKGKARTPEEKQAELDSLVARRDARIAATMRRRDNRYAYYAHKASRR